MWFTAIDRVGAARASLYANLQPFLGAFFALVVLSEEMGLLQIVGGIVIGGRHPHRALGPAACALAGLTLLYNSRVIREVEPRLRDTS